MYIRLKRGLNLRLAGKPANINIDRPAVSSVGLSGLDYPDVRPDFLVEQGQSVITGQPLLRDRRRPEIIVTSPAAGTVTGLTRRDPSTAAFFVGLSVSDVNPAEFNVPQDWRRGDAVSETLLASGLWSSFLERPFGRIPDPDGRPDTILVTAMPADELAPDPTVVLAGRAADFSTGIEALAHLADCPVHVCRAPGSEMAANSVVFSGVYPAGLPGTHIHHLCPSGSGSHVWTLNYQDVLAIGHLFNTEQLETHRIVTLAGPGVLIPTFLHVPLGADIEDLTRGRLREKYGRIVSGPFLSGRETKYLGRAHLEVCVQLSGPKEGHLSIFAHSNAVGPIIPIAAHQDTFPFDLPVVPLLRALVVGDSEMARDLGCLELIEEDVAVLSYICPSNNNYGPLLRSVLDELRDEL